MNKLIRILALALMMMVSAVGNAETMMLTPDEIKSMQKAKIEPKARELRKKLEKTTEPSERYRICDEISNLYLNQKEERPYLEEKLAMAVKMRDEEAIESAQLDMIRNLYEYDELEQLSEWIEKMKVSTKEKGKNWMLAKYYEIETMFWNGEMRDAWNELQNLNRAVEAEGNELSKAVLNVIIADIYSYIGQDDKAYDMIKEFLPVLSQQKEGRYLSMGYVCAIETSFFTNHHEEALALTQKWKQQIENGGYENDELFGEMQWIIGLENLIYHVYSGNVDKLEGLINSMWEGVYVPSSWSMNQFILMRAMSNRFVGNIVGVEQDINYLLDQKTRFRSQYFSVLGAAYWDKAMYTKSADAFRSANDSFIEYMRANMIREVEQYGELSRQFSEEAEMDDMRLSDARKLQDGIMISLGFAALAIIVLIGILYHNLKKARKLKQMNAEIDANSKRVAALNANLMEAIEEEEKSYKKKNEFIANISHEIRTPLNAIVGFSEILASNYSKDDESSEYTEIIRSNSDLMLDLVDQIIDNDLSKGGSYLHLEDVNVVNVAHNGLYSLSAIVKDGVKLEMKCEHETIIICTDRYRLQQLLTNLLGNAAAFTEKGKITLEVEKDDEYVTFNVIDTGCGIPKGQEKAIFGRFTKGSENSKGSGLGLYICSTICTQLHGKLYVDTTYNDGAKFVFKHPVALRDELESKKGGAS